MSEHVRHQGEPPEGHSGPCHGGRPSRHEDGHGGGHGGNWLVTYCDMITLLIAFFICIVTFAAKDSGNQQHPRKRDALIDGPGGTGVAGDKQAGPNCESIVWRQLPISARSERPGAAQAPLYSDPELEATAQALHLLETSAAGTLADSYAMRVPLSTMFTDDGKLSESGADLLGVVANSLRRLPYDIHVQADDPKNVPRAVAIARHLMSRGGLAAHRLGVGSRPPSDPATPSVCFLYAQRP